MSALPLGKAYAYTEGGDHRIGILAVASRDLGNKGLGFWVLTTRRSYNLQERAAAFLGLLRSSTEEEESGPKWILAPGVKLLENRESGAYLWNRSDHEDAVDVETRLPGWRFKVEYAGTLTNRGPNKGFDRFSSPLWAEIAWGREIPNEPYMVLAQVVQAERDSNPPKSQQFLIQNSQQFYGIACWAPVRFYPAYETVFENALSGLRVYSHSTVGDRW